MKPNAVNFGCSCTGDRLEQSVTCCFFFVSVLRLRRVPCGKPPAFRSLTYKRRGFASGGIAAKTVWGLTESQRLSAREGGKAA